MSNRAIGHVREFCFSSSLQLKNNFIMNNFTIVDSPILIVASIYNADLSIAGLSFILSDSNSKVLCSGSCGYPVISSEDAAAKALRFASQVMLNWSLNINVKTILSTSVELVKAIQQRHWSED